MYLPSHQTTHPPTHPSTHPTHQPTPLTRLSTQTQPTHPYIQNPPLIHLNTHHPPKPDHPPRYPPTQPSQAHPSNPSLLTLPPCQRFPLSNPFSFISQTSAPARQPSFAHPAPSPPTTPDPRLHFCFRIIPLLLSILFFFFYIRLSFPVYLFFLLFPFFLISFNSISLLLPIYLPLLLLGSSPFMTALFLRAIFNTFTFIQFLILSHTHSCSYSLFPSLPLPPLFFGRPDAIHSGRARNCTFPWLCPRLVAKTAPRNGRLDIATDHAG